MRGLTALTIVLLLMTGLTRAETAVVLEQVDPPLQITAYDVAFEPEQRSRLDQIRHFVGVRNISGRHVVAYQIGLTAFDTFNNLMGKMNGWSIEDVRVDPEAEGSWIQRPPAAFAFKKYGTGVAYVHAVRFDDGSIWRADMDAVLSQMQEFEASLAREDLEEK